MTALLWILAVLLILFLAVGLSFVRYSFVRRPLPDISDPEVLAHSSWSKYEPHVSNALHWLEQQEVKPLQVVSYDGKVLYGRFVPCENARGTILMFHGYRSHYAVDFSGSMRYYHDQGFHVLLVDQRAHGKSGGRFITFGVKERYDVLSWVTYLSLMLGEDHPMILAGLSMGATTVCMASDLEFPANVRCIAADCGFTSPADILTYLADKQYHLPAKTAVAVLNVFARLFAGFGLRQWSTEEALRDTKLPVAFFHGLADDFVPSWMSRRSYEACASDKILVEIEGAGHGTSFLTDSARYKRELEAFLNKHMPQGDE